LPARCYVSIPHGGLRTTKSSLLGHGRYSLSHHPAQRARKMCVIAYKPKGVVLTSPSHTVGSERKRRVGNRRHRIVSIPPSGLGTIQHLMGWYLRLWESPSHTVGLELSKIVDYLRDLAESPSHAVGLERRKSESMFALIVNRHPTQWAQNLCPAQKNGRAGKVTIPLSGLRTYYRKVL